MEFIKNKNFTWERTSKISEIPIRELELLCKQYGIDEPHIKVVITDSKDLIKKDFKTIKKTKA
jgi:hypothetical protein